MARLTYKDAAGVSRNVPLRAQMTIGRHPDQDIQILDRVVSKAHCLIELFSGRYTVRDSGSRNGTYLNGIRLAKARSDLKDGDEIAIGSTRLRFTEDREDSLMTRVTFHNDSVDTAIRSRVSGEYESAFLPEAQIKNNDTLRRDYEKLRIAMELQESIGLEFNQEMLLSKILTKAFQIFPADRGVILMGNHEKTLIPKIYKNREGRDTENIRISQTILKEVVDKKLAVLSHDAMSDSRFSGAHSIILEGIRSTVSVPLLYEDDLLGVIHLDSKNALGAFAEKDLQILTVFARQAAINIKHSRIVKRMEEAIVARQNLGRLLSPQLVDEVVSGRIEIKKGGEEREATMLFADIRGFTSLSERIVAQDLVDLLNNYFEVMVDVIFAHGGTLDKFVGDEIMALWGAPLAIEEAELKATQCALAMMDALAQFNELRHMEFEIGQESGTVPNDWRYEPLAIGIGIHSGKVVSGYIGSSKSLSYTVMGDPVNTASRLCGAAGAGDVLIGRSTFEQVKDLFVIEALPMLNLKGKRDLVEAFKVTANKPDGPAALNLELSSNEEPAFIDAMGSTGEIWPVAKSPRPQVGLERPSGLGIRLPPKGPDKDG